MRIKSINDYRNDFSAILVCEHCGHEQQLTSGYNDDYYTHLRAIPAIRCADCGRDRAWEEKRHE